VLRSLSGIAVPREASVAVVVVNNDPSDGRPVRVADSMRTCLPGRIVVIDEPRRGLTAPRNRAIEHVIDDFDAIAFVDDDGSVAPDWLVRLDEALERFGADAVTGPVTADLGEDGVAWIDAGGFFDSPARPTGTSLRHAFTHNAMIRCAFLRRTGLRFDDRFGGIGGEDTHFFRRFTASGGRIVWVQEAMVTDHVPAERQSEEWILYRQRRTGATTALIEGDVDGGVLTRPRLMLRGIAAGALGAVLWTAGLAAGRRLRLRGRIWLAWGRGLLEGVCGRVEPEYASRA